MASGWNLWVWLQCIGVVSGCCCKEVYRFPHITYPYSTFFLQQHPYFFVQFLIVFSYIYRIAGIFRGVKFSWIWKNFRVRGKNFVVSCMRALMSVVRCIYMVTVSWVNISWFTSQPRKPRKFKPPKNTRYKVHVIDS